MAYSNCRRNIPYAVYNPSKLRERPRRRTSSSLAQPDNLPVFSIGNNPQSLQEPAREPYSSQVIPGPSNARDNSIGSVKLQI